MTHTKSELKKAIAMCSRDIGNAECKLCPYDIGCDRCFVELNRDALEYIMELETENNRLFEIATGAERPRNDNGVKPCPVDLGKLLSSLECHIDDVPRCPACLYESADPMSCVDFLVKDAAAYIGWLEEKVEALEDEKPKGAWMMVYEDGECLCFRSGGESEEYDPRTMALVVLNQAVAVYRDELDAEAYAQILAETKNALADGSKFWEGLEADAKCPE